jgi:transcriptional regulator
MNRRDLLSSLVFAAVNAEAQETAPPSSLYIPNAHRVDDRKLLHDFMEEFAFVDLITPSPLHITHIPVVFERAAGPFGTIHGKQEAVIVFRGPHGYISPTCYQTNPAVPTWNFAVVHATGKLQPVTDPAALHAFLGRLIQKFESYEGTGYDFSKIPDSYLNPMLANIVGFDMRVELLEGKFKLGQERPEADRQGILKYLQTARPERSLHDLTQNFYRQKA